MSKLKAYVPFSILSFSAAAIAVGMAWDPGSAEAGKPVAADPALRTSIAAPADAGAPHCPDAVWPHVTDDCLLYPDRTAARRKVRTIVIDDRAVTEKRETLRRIMVDR